MEKVLSAENLSVGYGKKIIVDGLSFELQKGSILTLIGPNGAGKSTVLKTIMSQLPVISGKVALCGKFLSEFSEKEMSKLMSVLLTDKISAERMTCMDVAATGRYPYTGRFGILGENDRDIVKNAMRLTGVEELEDVDFHRISDGQRQCVMLARAMAQEPKVMLLDEPTSFLDISHKLRLLSLLRELVKNKDMAVIQSLHELDLAQKFSDTIICVKDGRADRIGTPEEIFKDDYIEKLYDIKDGSYNALYGTAEPPAPKGEPRVFVIGGGGAGIPVYRRLQKSGIPFAAGVLHENDVEYGIAKALAAEVVTEKAFEPVSDENIKKAAELMGKCGKVICCTTSFGAMNKGCKTLRDMAENEGSITDINDL